MKYRVLKILAAIALIPTSAYVPSAAADSKVLATDKGMTVYTFDKDMNGKSSCYGPCAAIWPPVRPGEMSGADLSVIQRDDSTEQLAFKGKPIYLFAADIQPGDAYGNNLQGVWHAIPASSKKAAAKPRGYFDDGYGGSSYGY